MPTIAVKKLRAAQDKARNVVLRAYTVGLQADLKKLPARRRTSSARQYKQRIISDYRNIIRMRQRRYASELRTNLFKQMNALIKNPELTNRLLDGKDNFGYTLSFSIQRANTRLIRKVTKLYDKNVSNRKLNAKEFYDQATIAVETQRYMQDLIDYQMARAFNFSRYAQFDADGVKLVRVKLSDRHRIYCVCNELAKTYPIDEVPLPPFHPHCECYVVALR